jgi:nitrogen fixation NifU-like protein
MSDLRELYQELILDHHKRPRNYGKLADANGKAEGFNPLCGDKLTIFVRVDDGNIVDVRFEGTGCAISTASASLMTESVKGKTRAEAEVLFGRMHDLLTAEPAVTPDPGQLGKLAVFAGVREFPIRVKCATLAWHTLRAALLGQRGSVTTE